MGLLEPWQLALAITGLPGVLLAFLVFTFPEPLRIAGIPGDGADRSSLRTFLKAERRALVPMFIGFGAVSITLGSLTTWVPTYMSRYFGWQPPAYGPALSIISLVGALSMILKGMVVDWLAGRGMRDAHLRFFSWLLAGTIPVGAAAFFLTNPWWFLISYGVLNVVALQFIVFMAATLQLFVPSDLRGQVTGMFLGFFTLLQPRGGPNIYRAADGPLIS